MIEQQNQEQRSRQAPIAQTGPPREINRRSPRRWRFLPAFAALLVLLAATAAATLLLIPRPPAAPIPLVEPVPKLTARGEVRAVSQARVGSLHGGVVQSLAVDISDNIGEQREVARIKGPDGTIEVLTAPFRGTVTGIPVHVGDTVIAGAVVLTIADLSLLRVETTDVDEFIIGSVRRGQEVRMIVDAIDRSDLRGFVRSVSLERQKNDSGDDHYPVYIDIQGTTGQLRPGMTVRVEFVAPFR